MFSEVAVRGRLSAVRKRQDSQRPVTGKSEGWKGVKLQTRP